MDQHERHLRHLIFLSALAPWLNASAQNAPAPAPAAKPKLQAV